MSKVSCYGCKYDGAKWHDECKDCVRITFQRPFKDKYAFDNKVHADMSLYIKAGLQRFDTKEPRLVANWEVPKDIMWHNPTCSNCGFESADHRFYCPNCGAKIAECFY